MANVATLDTNQLARLLDLSPRHVRQLAEDSVLARARDETGQELRGRWELIHNNHAYIHYLRRLARFDDSGETEYLQLRNRKMAAESEQAELQLRLYKKDLHRSDDVEFHLTNMLTAFKSRILAIPSRISRQLVGQTDFHVIYRIIMDEIVLALQELAGYSREQYAEQSEARLEAEGAGLAQLNGNGQNDSDGENVAGGFADEA